MDLDDKDLFMEQNPLEGAVIDTHVSESQKAITSLPPDFQIRTMSDIKTLEEFVAINYAKGIRLFRGHESHRYKIESTIVRHVKGKKKNGPIKIEDILKAEEKGYNLFCQNVFNKDWLRYKLEKSDDTLFKMSIARHLGLPCRLIDTTLSLETAIWFVVMNPKFYNIDGEVVLIVLDKNKVSDTNQSPFKATRLSYANEPFVVDNIDDLPLGEQRRFVQYGRFIWVDDSSLLSEKQMISDSAFHIEHFTIPWQSKLSLAIELYRDVYSGYAYQSDISKIKECI